MLRELSAVGVAAALTQAAVGGTIVFDNQGDFESFNQGQGWVLKGLDDFEESNLAQGQAAALSDPLEGNVPNVDANGLGFPTGLSQKNLVIQSNSLGANAATPSPGAGLAALGPDAYTPGVPHSTIVTVVSGPQSVDLIFTGSNHTAVGFDVTVFIHSTQAAIAVFDESNQQLTKQTINASINQKTFFGVWSGDSIGRINIAAVNPPGVAFVDNVQMWEPGPCPADLDGDGEVGILDFLMVLAEWGPCP